MAKPILVSFHILKEKKIPTENLHASSSIRISTSLDFGKKNARRRPIQTRHDRFLWNVDSDVSRHAAKFRPRKKEEGKAIFETYRCGRIYQPAGNVNKNNSACSSSASYLFL